MHKLAQNQIIENKSMQVAIEVLAKSIARWTDKPDRIMTAIPGLSLFRRDEPTQPASAMYEPSICLTTQGAKRILLGDDTYVYDQHHFLITSVDLPTVVQIIDASPEKPFLGLIVSSCFLTGQHCSLSITDIVRLSIAALAVTWIILYFLRVKNR